jgi:hypothetical protein
MPPLVGVASRLLDRHCPPEPPGDLQPPAIDNPPIACEIPVPDVQCERCGVLLWFWVYNPFSRSEHAKDGWVLWRTTHCRCDEERQATARAMEARLSALRCDYSQEWLDKEFHQGPVRRHTFLAYQTSRDKAAALLEPVIGYSHQLVGADRLPTLGVLLVGEPAKGKGHLLDALTNQVRYYGWPCVSLSCARLLELCTPQNGEAGESYEDRQELRKAVRSVASLAVKDLLVDPLLPSELKELDLILSLREEKGLLTHFSACQSPDRLLKRGGANADQVARLVERVRRMVDLTVNVRKENRCERAS